MLEAMAVISRLALLRWVHHFKASIVVLKMALSRLVYCFEAGIILDTGVLLTR
jgi:hypothetical protein